MLVHYSQIVTGCSWLCCTMIWRAVLYGGVVFPWAFTSPVSTEKSLLEDFPGTCGPVSACFLSWKIHFTRRIIELWGKLWSKRQCFMQFTNSFPFFLFPFSATSFVSQNTGIGSSVQTAHLLHGREKSTHCSEAICFPSHLTFGKKLWFWNAVYWK